MVRVGDSEHERSDEQTEKEKILAKHNSGRGPWRTEKIVVREPFDMSNSVIRVNAQQDPKAHQAPYDHGHVLTRE